jgi:uncharacterized protein
VLEFNVAQLEKSPIGTTREYELDDRMDYDGQTTRVTGRVLLTRTNRSILVKADLAATVPQECCRCLSPFEGRVSFTINEEFFPLMDVTSGLPLAPDEEGGDFIIDEHHVLDLTEAVRQYLILSQPMKPLCRPDCQGILPGPA